MSRKFINQIFVSVSAVLAIIITLFFVSVIYLKSSHANERMAGRDSGKSKRPSISSLLPTPGTKDLNMMCLTVTEFRDQMTYFNFKRHLTGMAKIPVPSYVGGYNTIVEIWIKSDETVDGIARQIVIAYNIADGDKGYTCVLPTMVGVQLDDLSALFGEGREH